MKDNTVAETFSVPLVCETTGCNNSGNVVNLVSGIIPQDLDLFYEDYDGSAPEDRCPLCGQPAIAQDPLREPQSSR